MKTVSIPPATSGKARLRGVALAVALQHGFVAVLVFALIAAFFLKDVPFVPTSAREAESES